MSTRRDRTEESPADDAAVAAGGPALADLPERYVIVRLLGHGAQKRVYLARDARLDRQVAIAAIDTTASGFPDSERLQEARTMARIGDHAHVTSIYDVIEAPNALYIVSQFIPGGDLQGHLRDRGRPALPVAQAVRLAAQVCRALEHVHERGIAHRDVKPSNIFLDERGDAVLGDFGLADTRTALAGSDAARVFVGTPEYVAPEQIWGHSVAGSDLYSLGCVLCELLTGAPPFRGRDVNETLQLHLHGPVVSARSRNPAVPPALDDLVAGLLAKEPEARPDSSRDVRAALEGILVSLRSSVALADDAAEPAAEGIHSLPPRELVPLVGRDEERRMLRRLATRAAAGEPAVLFLEGEAGVGKSRLLREFRADAEERGAIVLIGHAYQDAPLPYRPFVEALLPLAGRLSAVDRHDAELVRRFLYVDRAADVAEPAIDKSGRERLVAAVYRTLVEISRTRPIAIVIEDLHWADSASLDLFEHLMLTLSARAARSDLRLALAASVRPVEPDHPVGRLLKRAQAEVICETRSLAGLAQDAVYEVLRGLGIERPSEQLIHTVHRVTEGNPLYIAEFLEHLKRQGALRQLHGATVSSVESTDITMPSSMAAVIADRIREISPGCRELLILGAFLGPAFELAAVASVAGDPLEACASVLGEAITGGLLLEDNRAYRFAHPLVRQALYQEPRAAGRQQIHLRIVDYLESEGVHERSGGVLEIAHHLTRAGTAADAERVARCTAEAADRAMQSFAWHEAAALLESAIAAAGRGAALSGTALAELHRRAGIAYFNRFDTGPCVQHLDLAIAGFREADDVTGLAQALNDRALLALQLGLVGFGTLQELQPLEDALQRLDDTQRSLRARILATLSESHWNAQNAGRAVALAEEAMQLACADGNDRMCADISVQLSLAHMQHLQVDQALASYQRGIAYARAANHLSGLEQCLQRNAVVLFMSGRLHDAERAAAEAQELNEIVRHAADATWTSYIMLTLAALRGDHAAAEQHAKSGVELLRRGSYPYSGAAMLTALASARALRDDSDGANRALDLMLEPGLLFEDVQPLAIFAQPYRVLIRAYAGGAIEAAELEGVPMMALTDDGFDFSLLPFLCAWVELGAVADPPRAFPELTAALALADERGIAFSAGWPFLVSRILGSAAAAEERWHDAVRFFERAIGLTQGAGATPELLRTQIDYAAALAARDHGDDRLRAQRLIQRALPDLATCCPTLVRHRAAALVQTLA